MRGGIFARATALALLGLAASACGGYSSKGKYYPPAVPQLLLAGDLSGAAETTVVSATAQGASLFDFHSDGNVTFAVTAQASYVAGITGVHIHRGDPGLNGPAEIDVLGQGASFDPATRTAAGTLLVSASLASEIIVSPAYFYVQITTTAAPNGIVRGQLAAAAPSEVHALIRGSEETTVVDATARGAATFSVALDGSVHYVLAMAKPAISQITAAHIHAGVAGSDGAIEVDLDATSATSNVAEQTLTGDFDAPLSLLSRMALDLSSFYVNVHTVTAPAGIARAQLVTGSIGLFATLAGANELPVVDANARGGVTLELTSFTAGRAIYAVPVSQGIAAVNGAHVHLGAPFVNGPSVLDLRAGADFAVGSQTAEGAITLNQTLFARLLGNPTAFYADIHTATAPGGLARGQLGTDPVTFRAVMLGANNIPIADPTASGVTKFIVTGVHSGSFDVTMTSPAATALTGAHIHAGASGTNGGIVIDFLDGTGITTTATRLTGDVTFIGQTLASMMAAPELFYSNMHTLAAPNGVCRAQLVRVSDSSPPAGLAYASPVVYVTNSPIAPNQPTSTGGAVASYTIAPALPTGLSINATSGIISGTPTVTAVATVYTVTATNTAGSTNANLNLTVNVAAPTNLVYATPVTYINGTAITANTPTNSGGTIASYTVLPALPTGLSLHPTTGVITGTPTVTLAAANYVVTGTNVTSSTTSTINITVQATLTAPTGLSYANAGSYPTGYAITSVTPSQTGGSPPATYSVSPGLPTGLVLDTTTGVFSGKPTVVTANATYTVTATNGAGSTTAPLTFSLTLGAPKAPDYGGTNFIGYVAPPFFNNMTPGTDVGGAVATYSITPGLPAGLTLNTSTGVITGPPTATSAQTQYTVTATNATGTNTVQFTINVPY